METVLTTLKKTIKEKEEKSKEKYSTFLLGQISGLEIAKGIITESIRISKTKTAIKKELKEVNNGFNKEEQEIFKQLGAQPLLLYRLLPSNIKDLETLTGLNRRKIRNIMKKLIEFKFIDQSPNLLDHRSAIYVKKGESSILRLREEIKSI